MPPEINKILEEIYAILSSGENIPDQIYDLVAEELERLLTPAPHVPEVPDAPFPSSNIHGFKYNPKNKELLVKFQDKYPGTNGSVYKYSNIPDYIFNIFKRGGVGPKTSGKNAWHRWRKGVTPSLGAAMNALIKSGGFPYQKLA